MLCCQMHPSAHPAEHQWVQHIPPFMAGIQTRFQRLQRQLLARQRTTQSADSDRPLQAQVRLAVM